MKILSTKNGTYTGDGQGFGGNIQVQVTLSGDEITDIQVTSAPGEDAAYLSQGEGVISSIISAQSTDVDTVSGATFSSTGIIKCSCGCIRKGGKTHEKKAEKGPINPGCYTAYLFIVAPALFPLHLQE